MPTSTYNYNAARIILRTLHLPLQADGRLSCSRQVPPLRLPQHPPLPRPLPVHRPRRAQTQHRPLQSLRHAGFRLHDWGQALQAHLQEYSMGNIGPRPDFSCKSSFGMPSSHMIVMAIFALYRIRNTSSWTERAFWVVMTVLEGVSRMELNYHTLEQVIAGTIFGVAYALIF